jgi:hypothetical protein
VAITTAAKEDRNMDPNKAYLPFDPFPNDDARRVAAERAGRVQHAVRAAMVVLNMPERAVIEGYYFDGCSLPHLADQGRVTLARIRTIHTRALAKLRVELTPFVMEMYGLTLTHAERCPICTAEWRDDAEHILDEKTDDMTWGDIIIRLERAVGWRAKTPQVLMTHQRRHRTLKLRTKGDTS